MRFIVFILFWHIQKILVICFIVVEINCYAALEFRVMLLFCIRTVVRLFCCVFVKAKQTMTTHKTVAEEILSTITPGQLCDPKQSSLLNQANLNDPFFHAEITGRARHAVSGKKKENNSVTKLPKLPVDDQHQQCRCKEGHGVFRPEEDITSDDSLSSHDSSQRPPDQSIPDPIAVHYSLHRFDRAFGTCTKCGIQWMDLSSCPLPLSQIKKRRHKRARNPATEDPIGFAVRALRSSPEGRDLIRIVQAHGTVPDLGDPKNSSKRLNQRRKNMRKHVTMTEVGAPTQE